MLNNVGIGREVAVIDKGAKGFINLISDNKKHNIPTFKELKLTKGTFKMAVNDTDISHYIAGSPGCGKSYVTCKYAQEYKKKFPDNKIFLFSEKNSDETLDKCAGIKRIKLDDSIIEDPIPWEEFHDSLVIFDDIDAITDKPMKKALELLSKKILNLGRDRNIYIIITHHDLIDGHDTKSILRSAKTITYFPYCTADINSLYLAKNYGNCNKRDVEKIKQTGTRWATIFRSYPPIILTEKEIWQPN